MRHALHGVLAVLAALAAGDSLHGKLATILAARRLKGMTIVFYNKNAQAAPIVRAVGAKVSKDCDGAAADADTVSMLVSSSKTYTGLLAVMAVEKGYISRFSPDDDINSVLSYHTTRETLRIRGHDTDHPSPTANSPSWNCQRCTSTS